MEFIPKIKEIKLSAVRGINYFISRDVETFGSEANFVQMPQADTAIINVFAGPNGAGKSTFLDTVRVLGDAELLLTLRRSTLSPGLAYHSFRLALGDETVINVEFEATGHVSLRHLQDNHHEQILDETYPIIKGGKWIIGSETKAETFFEKIGLNVEFWAGPSSAEFDLAFFDELTLLSPYLTGVDSIFPVVIGKQVRPEAIITLTDEPGQSHLIQASELPAGWKAAAGLLSWVSQLDEGSLCIIEEPETHLHPFLQRRLASRLGELAAKNKLQVFLSTHSPIFLHPSNWKVKDGNLAIFHVDGKTVNRIDNTLIRHGRLLDDLGARVSDLLQANCVVWVEGPSDRIYIRLWLEKWCEYKNLRKPIENIHYVFSFYGGSILSHFDAGPADEVNDAVSMLKLNRNSMVIMDRDNDFKPCAACGTIIRTNRVSAKYQVVDDLRQLTWITEGYTIESYLPENYFDDGYLKKSGVDRVEIGTKLSKVKLARKYETDHENSSFPGLFGAISPKNHVARLYSFILAANHEI